MATKTLPTTSEVEAMLKALKDFGLALAISGQTLQLKQNNTIISSITLPSGSDIDLENVGKSILPASNDTYDIGSSSKNFRNIYCNYVYQNSSTYPYLYQSSRRAGSYINLYGGGTQRLKIETGATYINTAKEVNYTINFPSTFTSAPKVIITPLINNSTDARYIHYELTYVGTSSFRISFLLENTDIKISYLHWIAIGI